MRYLVVLFMTLSMFIGCEPQKSTSNTSEEVDKSCIEYCVFDLVNKTEWHGIEANKAMMFKREDLRNDDRTCCGGPR